MQTTLPCANGHLKPQVLPQGPATLPEAACSVNIRFRVEGYGEAQATGRGATAHEAAANLRSTMEATRLALAPEAPPPPPSREERIAQLLTKGLACAVAKGDFALAERLGKAAVLVLSNSIEPTDSPAVMAVRSMASREHWYEVSGQVCTCPNSEKHVRNGERYLCKHALSVEMYKRIEA